MKAKIKQRHPWLVARGMETAFVVIRIDDVVTDPLPRGCLPTANLVKGAWADPQGDQFKRRGGYNFWKTADEAIKAATWATNKYGHQYGVFEMCYIVEQLDRSNVTPVARG